LQEQEGSAMSIRISVHLRFGNTPETRSRVALYPNRPPLAFVEAAGVEFIADSPADLLAIAEAFNEAARQLSSEIDPRPGPGGTAPAPDVLAPEELNVSTDGGNGGRGQEA
jgi:hypothetical protein